MTTTKALAIQVLSRIAADSRVDRPLVENEPMDLEGGSLLDDSSPAAVRLRGTRCGDVWLVLDETVLIEHPDIATSGLPVFFFDEVPYLAHLDAIELAAVAACKRVFPTGRVVQ